MNHHAMSRLSEAAKKNGPLCVGLDTSPASIPTRLLQNFPSPAVRALPAAKQIPIIALGGISTWRDTVEFIMAGASAVQKWAQQTLPRRAPCLTLSTGCRILCKKKAWIQLRNYAG